MSSLVQATTLGGLCERLAKAKSQRPEGVEVFDTTCRDGGQTRGITWTAEDKIAMVGQMIQAGLLHIELGWPVPGDKVNPRVFKEVGERYADSGATFYAFSGTERADREINPKSPLIKCLLDTGADDLVIFGKSWKKHTKKVLRISDEANLRIIRQTVAVLTGEGKKVVYDGEHSVDGWRDDRFYFFQTLEAAIAGGASRIVLCDTRGGAMSSTWLEFLLDVVPWLNEQGMPWGVHTHNDSGLADALALLAVEFGCDHIQGTIGGIGERCGNANLSTLVPDLAIKMGIEVVSPEQLKMWTELTQTVFGLAGLDMPYNLPHVSKSAFHHEAGTHSDAFIKAPEAVEYMPAALVGNHTTTGVSNQAGRALMCERLSRIIPDIGKGDERLGAVLDQLHGLESEGWLFETAPGSFELLSRAHLGLFNPFFEVFECNITENLPPFSGVPGKDDSGEDHRATAVVGVRLADGSQIHPKVGQGDGPVNAVDVALRTALQERGGQQREAAFPQLKELEFLNYHVKALVDHDGTAAQVRVVIFWRSNGDEVWGTVAVSGSVNLASAQAVAAGYQYFLDCWQRKHADGQPDEAAQPAPAAP